MRHRERTTATLAWTWAITAICGPAAFTDSAQGQDPLNIFGLPHTPLGQAQLDVDGNGNLVVGNIGSSGEDGVSVDLGQAQGFVAEVDFGQAGEWPPGTLFQLDTVAMPPPQGRPLCLLLREANGGQAQLFLDTSFFDGPDLMLLVELLLDGVVVDSMVYRPNPGKPIAVGSIGSSGKDGLIIASLPALRPPGDTFETEMVSLSGTLPQPIMLPPGGFVDADQIRITLTGLPDGTILPTIMSLKMRAANLETGHFAVFDEALGIFGLPNRAVGQAQMMGFDPDKGQPLQLIVSNIGSSGEDGVSVGVSDPGFGIIKAGLHMDIPDVPTAGAFLEAAAEGLNAEPFPIPVGSTRAINVMNLGMHVGLRVDFTPIGVETYTGQIYNMGELVAEVMGLSGPVAINETDLNLSAISQVRARAQNFGFSSPSFDWKITSVQTITLPDGTAVPGDQVVFIAELDGVAGFVIDSLSEVSLVAADVPSFTITDETIELAPPCPADLDGSGAVDVKDLLILLGAWGPNKGHPADLDGSGAVDVKDLLELLGAWGPCP